LLDKNSSLPFSLSMHQNASSVIGDAFNDLPGDLRRRVIKELGSGIQKEWVQAGIHQQRIAKDSQADRRSIDGIGRLRMRIDPTLYHAWGTKLGYGCWKDSQFLREIERDNPEVRVKSTGTRLQVGFDGAKRSSQKFDL
jgi:hypothetical protein